jgi:hypothetical protein
VRNCWFEIVRRTYDRFSWVFIEEGDGRRRILARSHRDYRSRKKVRRAVARLQLLVDGAEVRDGAGWSESVELPNTSFHLAPYALPLLVGEPSARIDQGFEVRFPGRRRRRTGKAALGERTEQAVAGASVSASGTDASGKEMDGPAPAADSAGPTREPARAARKTTGRAAAKKSGRSSPSRRSGAR